MPEDNTFAARFAAFGAELRDMNPTRRLAAADRLAALADNPDEPDWLRANATLVLLAIDGIAEGIDPGDMFTAMDELAQASRATNLARLDASLAPIVAVGEAA